jgi:hypothetical protein
MKLPVQNPTTLSGNHLFTKSNLEIKLNKPGYYEICDHKWAKVDKEDINATPPPTFQIEHNNVFKHLFPAKILNKFS